MAPIDIVDYVVVHELSHLREHNHSRKFWDQVGAILSDFKTRRKWLKENGRSFHWP
jgi:predicted metal-dependent hydrolase